MHISLQATCSLPHRRTESVPVSVTIKPINNILGSYEYQTDSSSLFRLLRKTDLAGYTLDRFRTELSTSQRSRLPHVNLEDEVLQAIGYFVE